ncbi:helix-turn-helix domain-containing protein [Micromonospora sp. CPCC 206060]|uniref:helix-turn-helix domain-containing protein n=1 Tax=Micromonospora sp. CPCC 206060 TaxID=3122406 RepID=UPI003FA5E3C0
MLPDLLDWLRQHLDQRWSLDALGARVHMSPRTLSRRFHRLTGMSPHQWLVRERILAAQRLLESGDEPVAQIAVRTGDGLGRQPAAQLPPGGGRLAPGVPGEVPGRWPPGGRGVLPGGHRATRRPRQPGPARQNVGRCRRAWWRR